MRMFVALPVPERTREELAYLCCGLPGARWVHAENFHITLRFLGEIDGGTAEDVDTALAGIHAPEFDIEIADVGCFANGRNVRSVWAGVKPTLALVHLHDKVESAVVRAGLDPDGKRFTPHVTLTRSKVSLGDARAWLVRNSLFRAIPFEATHFTLFRSFIGGEGAIYRAESEYALDMVRDVA
ncbi:MAG: RNA 2',3'-cyclic phosphodiesterase [Rhodospirillaceae bacterium]|nr:RNA 2',3'-cyclic phosphodiesterase [Rhodospirillaceae bacterium]